MSVLVVAGRHMRRRIPGDEVDHTLLPLLQTLTQVGAARHTELAEILELDASTVSRQVRHLSERGLVHVGPDAHDARARRVEILPAGTDVLTASLARRRDLVADVLAQWSDEDASQLGRLLDRLDHDLSATTVHPVLPAPRPSGEARP